MSRSNRSLAEQGLTDVYFGTALGRAVAHKQRGQGPSAAEHTARMLASSHRDLAGMIAKAGITGFDTGDGSSFATAGPLAIAALVRQRGIARIPGARPAPARTRLTALTGGARAAFVTEGKPIPVNALEFGDRVMIEPGKIAVIKPYSKELAEHADPSSFPIMRDDLVGAIAEAQLDVLFDGDAAIPEGRPASVLYGVPPIASGSPQDLEQDVTALVSAVRGGRIASPVFLVSLTGALFLATLRAAGGQRLFPDLGMTGGSILGAPVIVTPAADDKLILLDGAALYFFEGGVELDSTSQASFQFSDAPTDGAAQIVALFQSNTVAIRALQYCGWRLATPDAVAWVELPVGSPIV